MTVKEAWKIIKYINYKHDCEEFANNYGMPEFVKAWKILENLVKNPNQLQCPVCGNRELTDYDNGQDDDNDEDNSPSTLIVCSNYGEDLEVYDQGPLKQMYCKKCTSSFYIDKN